MKASSVLVVGGGVMGMATACALAGRGATVTVLERHTVGHDWASSHGLTRAIRHEYGPNAIYTRMVARSLTLWDELARETGRRLYTETGVLTLGQEDDGETLAGYDVMLSEGLPIVRLTPQECGQRFPQFQPQDYSAITWNSSGGMLHASECLAALRDRLAARGGQTREGAQVTRVEPLGGRARVRMADGETLEADRVVVTAGPWAPDLLAGMWRAPVRATRQQVNYFAGADPAAFGVGGFPVFLAGMEYYGLPLQGPGWLKVASHIVGPTVNPETGYPSDSAEVDRVRDFMRRVIPMAAELKLALVDRCMYDLTPDEDFILDHLPGAPSIIVGSGFSGHGFKFGVLIGELLAALALDEAPAFPLERFSLSRFDQASTLR
ncbi:MAG TPA: N-methyl-L-tryptophan oxidase [Ktedonobacterales bacterium]|jgi:monomeric sarcosine oxidase|nr:N-methyl-L-tryptophan oxidase [Ktedonobacterales bacterium]